MSILFAISNVSGKSRPTIYKGQFKTILRFGQEVTVTYLLHCFQLKNFIDEIMASANLSFRYHNFQSAIVLYQYFWMPIPD